MNLGGRKKKKNNRNRKYPANNFDGPDGVGKYGGNSSMQYDDDSALFMLSSMFSQFPKQQVPQTINYNLVIFSSMINSG